MNGVYVKNWRVRSIPGGVQCSSRQVFDGKLLLIEEVVLEASPLTLAKTEREKTYPRRAK